jgi:hypothetical protein
VRHFVFAILIVLGSVSLVGAQDLENTSGLSCREFKKGKDGAWRARSWILLPCGAPLTPGTPFIEGSNLCGRDLASELDDACGE